MHKKLDGAVKFEILHLKKVDGEEVGKQRDGRRAGGERARNNRYPVH